MKTIVPDIDETVLRFCSKVVPSTKPFFVQHKPEGFAKLNSCFPSVQEKIHRDGGRIQHGWQIWLWPDVLIEAEFHAVWVAPNGDHIDITPNEPLSPLQHVLFLPDPYRIYEGKQTDNIRHALTPNQLMGDFIFLAEAKFTLLNENERAMQHRVRLEGEDARRLNWIEAMQVLLFQMINDGSSPRSQCLCRQGASYRNCHGREVQKLQKRQKNGHFNN